MNQRVLGYSIIATYGSFFIGAYWANNHYHTGIMFFYAVAALLVVGIISKE